MMMTFKPHRRLQLHALKNHSAGNLNRDDAGRPKEVRFGGVRRLRQSSQSIKFAMRKGEVFGAFRTDAAERYGAAKMVRTRRAAEELQSLLRKRQLDEGHVQTAIENFAADMEKEKEVADGDEVVEAKVPQTQLLALSQRELEAIADMVAGAPKDEKDWFKKSVDSWSKERKGLRMRGDHAPELQLFGRMITARKFFDNIDAPLQVAHAFTTHEAVSERDYWIGADDIGETSGASMIDVRRFGAGVFYYYACLDIDLLRSNLRKAFVDLDDTQITALLGDLVETLMWAFAVQNPTGYQNSFASHAIAETFIAEIGGGFPHSAAAAFENPVSVKSDGYFKPSVEALRDWDSRRKELYGAAAFPALKSMGLGVETDQPFIDLVSDVRREIAVEKPA